MDIENLKKAVTPGEGLTVQQRADNYQIFQKWMDDGVYIPDLVEKMDRLEQKVDEMKNPGEGLNEELFGIMESAVRDEPQVMELKRRLQDEKTRIIADLCMKDDAYRRVFNEYRTTVNASYIRRREKVQAEDGRAAPPVRYYLAGSISDKKGVQNEQEARA